MNSRSLIFIRAIGSVAFTVPACWYLLSSRPEVDHSTHEEHAKHGDEHAEEHEEKEEEQEEPKEEEQPAQESEDKPDEPEAKEESKEESTDSEKSDDSGSDDQKDDTPVTTEDESERDDQNTKKIVPDAKGGNKKRLESNNGMKQGELDEKPEEGKDSVSGFILVDMFKHRVKCFCSGCPDTKETETLNL